MRKILIFNAGFSVYGAERGLINFVKAVKDEFIITVVLPKKGPLAKKLKSISANIKIKIFPLPVLAASFSPVYFIKTALLFVLSLIYFTFYVILKKTDISALIACFCFLRELLPKLQIRNISGLQENFSHPV